MRLFHSARWLLLALLLSVLPASSYGAVFISVGFAPPVLPIYEAPPCPAPNMIWTPGYWAYGPDGYYWVPGAWVPAPFLGALWTPGYWGWSAGLYVWHPGYWGRHVGYYGGVNYGFGYFGIGFAGGEWRGDRFAYNTAVYHVDDRYVHNTFRDRAEINRYTVANPRHVAYAGGPGGINHPPGAEARLAERDQHMARTSFQTRHAEAARADRSSYARFNGGHPTNLFASRPLGAETHAAPGMYGREGNNAARPNAGRPNYQAPRGNAGGYAGRPNDQAPRGNAGGYAGRPNNQAPRGNAGGYAGRPNNQAPRGNAGNYAGRPNYQAPRSNEGFNGARPNSSYSRGARPQARPQERPQERPQSRPEQGHGHQRGPR
jgi:WXXGXW repeat (2 copies)